MAELFKLPGLLQLHAGGRKVWRGLAPRKVIEPALPAIVSGAAKLKAQIQVAKARLDKMPNSTDKEKKVYQAHKAQHDKMTVDLADFEALLKEMAPKAKAKK